MLAADDVPAGTLHVVYGANEAGKSTALRAVSGLLFGIPMQTRDAHHHRMADLRIGAALEAADGTVIEVVRRKGSKNTLLDPEGNILPEDLLRRVCGAATETTFRALFGLDHVSLREGAEALLAGRGDVGESLFDAALGGGRGIHRVLGDLEREADELFTRQAQKRKLNEAIRAYQEARGTIRLKARSGEAWLTQTRALEEAKADRERLAEVVRGRKRELQKLERARRLLPLCARRERLLERTVALGEVVLLQADAAKLREAVLHDRRQAADDIARLAVEIADVCARRDDLAVPPWLDEPAVARLAGLPDRLGAHRKAAGDRPRLASLLTAREAEVQALVAELRGGASTQATTTLHAATATTTTVATATMAVGVAEQARVRTLSLSEAALIQGQAQATRALDEIERRHRGRRDAIAALPPDEDSAPLRRLLRRIEREGDLESQHQEAARERENMMADLDRRLPPLGLAGKTGGEVLALPVPAPESVERFAGELRELVARNERLRDDLGSLQRRGRAVDRKLAVLTSAGQVPSIQTLADARSARADAWARLRGAWEGSLLAGRAAGPAPPATLEWPAQAAVFETALSCADDAADRLLREADRVASAGALEAERDEIGKLVADAESEREDLDKRLARARISWRGLWTAAGVVPEEPEDMRGWLRRFGEASDVARHLERATVEAERLDGKLRRARDEVRMALYESDFVPTHAATGAGAARSEDTDMDLGALCEQATVVAHAREETAHRRQALATEIATLAEDLLRARRDSEEAAAALGDWRGQWAEAIGPLGLRPDASAAEATAVLDVAGALARKQEEAADLQRRIRSIDRDATELEEAVRDLARTLAPDLGDRPVEEAAETLLQRHRDGVQARQARAAIEDDLRRRRATERAAVLAHAAAEERLGQLLRAARANDLTGLEEAERRSVEALDLGIRLRESEDQILASADGLALDAALTEVRGASAEDLDERIDRLREEMETLEAETKGVDQRIGSVGEGLRLLEEPGGADAAEAAGEAQGHLARIRTLAEQYSRLRIAARLLSREIERYREEHQGPVLARASALLDRLTLGRYTGLRADFDDSDRPVLCCVRDDGTKVSVEGLSDGARDQLFLALRLATLEQQATASEPLPLILDDILIHFDDERAGAALGVLAEHARATQVVLFTHHTRIVDLAQRAVPTGRLRISRLDG